MCLLFSVCVNGLPLESSGCRASAHRPRTRVNSAPPPCYERPSLDCGHQSQTKPTEREKGG